MKTQIPMANVYQVLCYVSLGFILLAQHAQGMALGNMLVVAIGLLGVVSKLRLGPHLLLGGVAVVQTMHYLRLRRFANWLPQPGALEVVDLLLCVGVLGYVIGHYRMQSLSAFLLPVDPRRTEGISKRWLGFLWRRRTTIPQKRFPDQVTPTELVVTIATLPIWALVAQLWWLILAPEYDVFNLQTWLVRFIMIVWMLAVSGFLASAVFGYWRSRQHDRRMAALYLQEQLWKELRGDQRRIERWAAYDRLRHEE